MGGNVHWPSHPSLWMRRPTGASAEGDRGAGVCGVPASLHPDEGREGDNLGIGEMRGGGSESNRVVRKTEAGEETVLSIIGEKLKASEWIWGPEFRHEEFRDPQGEPDSGLYMRPEFMDRLLALRRLVGLPVIIHANGGFSTQGHAEHSAHYKGLAADLHVPEATLKRTSDCIRMIEFAGVGLYPEWKPMPGFHLDQQKRRARWVRVGGEYISLS